MHSIPDLRLIFFGEVDTFGIAATFKVEDPIVPPAMFIITDETTAGISRKGSFACAGETKEEVTFVDVDAFGRQAETIAQYMKKGSPFLMEGRLRLDQWDDKQTGQKRSRLGVVLEGFQFLGTGNRAEGVPSSAEPPRRPVAPAAPVPSPEPDGPPPAEDDVPF